MQNFEHLVDRIYQATTKPDLWPPLLHDLGLLVDAAGGILFTRRNDRWLGFRNSPGFERSRLEAYIRSDAARRSITTTRLVAANRSGFVSDQELFTDKEYALDPAIVEWAVPNGLYHGAATAIQVPTGDMVVVQFMRYVKRSAFSHNDLDQLDAFRPHLARAGLLAARWRLERLKTLPEALALIELPAAVLDLSGSVLAANSLIQQMTSHIVWLPKDRVEFRDPVATTLLRRAITDINNPAALSVRSFPVREGRRGEPIVAHLIPISAQSRDLFEGGFGVLVATPLSAPNPLDIALIKGLFDLTAAEARVACGIVEGMTVKEMAIRYRIGNETVRTQVKAVLAKTGTRRQIEAAVKLTALHGTTKR